MTHSNSSKRASATVPAGPQRGQVKPGHTVACILGEEPEHGEPKSFKMGNMTALCSGGRHYILSMDVPMSWKREWNKGQSMLHLKDVQKRTRTLERCLPTNTWSYKTNNTFPASLAARWNHLNKPWSIKREYFCGSFWEIAKMLACALGPFFPSSLLWWLVGHGDHVGA